ncbi:hypothetical protein R50073_29080 [Maricurvus nonylphenolicus]|uniref:ankyrin repeat domain-containing protein n=1 Tax=Maricurvus nonylphenolicus TaxID=1008307 RepID=UPI0036F440DA
MSEVKVEIIASQFEDNEKAISSLSPYFDKIDENVPFFEGYHIEDTFILDDFLSVTIVGASSLDTNALEEALKQQKPTWLYIKVNNYQEDSTRTLCINGDRKTTKKTLIKNVRETSTYVNLYFAVLEDEIDTIVQLLKGKAIDSDVLIQGCPLTIHALRIGNTKLFKFLADSGIDLNSKLEKRTFVEHHLLDKGLNILSAAIILDAKSIVNHLIKLGVDVNCQNSDETGTYPIHIASGDRKATHKYIEILVNAGADINQEDSRGCTPIFGIFSGYTSKYSIQISEKMIAMGANISHISKHNETVKWRASCGDQELSDYLASKGMTDIAAPDDFYTGGDLCRYLLWAMNHNDIISFKRFLNDVDSLTREEQASVLHKLENLEFAKLLIESGVPAHLRVKRRGYDYAYERTNREVGVFLKSCIGDFLEKAEKEKKKVTPVFESLLAQVSKDIDEAEQDRLVDGYFSTFLKERLDADFKQRVNLMYLAYADWSKYEVYVNDDYEVEFQGEANGGQTKVLFDGEQKIKRIDPT